MADIQWFPGHMAKTRRMIKESIRLCDCVVEIVDARRPQSGRNPELPSLTGGKPVLLVINKSDIAGGSTLGNLAAEKTCINTVDVGLPQLAMHSAWETAGAADTEYLARAMKEFYSVGIFRENGNYKIK